MFANGQCESTLVAAVQLAPVLGDVPGNLARARAAIRGAAATGARLVVLPELCSSGYAFRSPDEAREAAELASGPTVRGWAAEASATGAVVVGGFLERDPRGRLFNSAAVLAPDGNVLAVYRKVHLWDQEKRLFEPGEEPLPVLDTPVGRLGVGVCYDLMFPEATRPLALAGAEIAAFPTNSPALGPIAEPLPMEVVVAMATAYVNRVHVVVADRCGAERGIEWVGCSAILRADGTLLAGPPRLDAATLTAPVELPDARDKRWGELSDALGDRRPELYARRQDAQPLEV